MDASNPYQSLVQLLFNVLEAHTTAFFLFDPKKRSLRLEALASISRQITPDLTLPLEQSGILSQIHKLGQDVELTQVSPEDVLSKLPFYRDAESNIKGLFATPVGEGIGVLYADTRRSYGFNRVQVRWAREFAALLAEQHGNLDSIRACNRYARILELWYHLDEIALSGYPPENYFHSMVGLCTKFLGVDHGFLALNRAEADHYRLVAATQEVPSGYVDKNLSLDHGLLGHVLSARKSLLIKRLKPEAMEHFVLFPGESLPHTGTFWGIPIETESGQAYAIAFLSRYPHGWDTDDQYAITRVMGFIRVLLEHSIYRRSCGLLQTLEPATGLLNAAAFEHRFESLLEECMRDSAALNLALVQFEPWLSLHQRSTPGELREWQRTLAYNVEQAASVPEAQIGQLAENRYGLLIPGANTRDVRVLLKNLGSLEWQIVLRKTQKVKLRPFSAFVRYPNDGTTDEELWPLAYRRLLAELGTDEKARRESSK